MAMGALAGTLGGFLSQHQQWVNLLCGLVVVFFGLTYLGVVKINLFKGGFRKKSGELGFFSALAFGVVFSVGWTPCVGVFLGSALMLAGQQGTMVTGLTLLLCYSLGLGIPFLVSAVIVDKLKSAFGFIKQHYGIINKVCGGLLVLMGILMATGLFERLTRLLS